MLCFSSYLVTYYSLHDLIEPHSHSLRPLVQFASPANKDLCQHSSVMSSSSIQSHYRPSFSTWRRPAPASCTPEELTAIITGPRGMYEIPSDPYNEVFPGIILGDGTTALCVMKLRSLGVSHVLNTAWGKDRSFGLINTSKHFYKAAGIQFHGIEAIDVPSFSLKRFFKETSDFIDEALRNGGKVYVHCQMGISRSSTIVLAYLIMMKGWTAQEAVRTVRARRQIIPNDGFLRQLCQLNEEQMAERQAMIRRQRLANPYHQPATTLLLDI